MKRDWRLLLAAILIIVGFALSVLYHHTWTDWAVAFQTGDWEPYGREYAVDVANALDQRCYHCWPTNPYHWTVVGPMLVIAGVFTTLLCWWKPKK